MKAEQEEFHDCKGRVLQVLREVWPEAALHPMGATAAGQSCLANVTHHFYASNTTTTATEESQLRLISAATAVRAHASFAVDYRQLPCVTVTDARRGYRFCIRVGETAVAQLEPTALLLRDCISATETTRAVLNVLMALFNQNKVLDENGTTCSLLCGEAVAVMVLAVTNSYSVDDVPDAGRLLLDFFLTFGFASHFNSIDQSVSQRGFASPTPKRHAAAQLSVLDPANEEVNLTPVVQRVSDILAVLRYCYTAIDQYTNMNTGLHRAQSALSTILAGEPFWGRVLKYYEVREEPYFSTIQLKKRHLTQYM